MEVVNEPSQEDKDNIFLRNRANLLDANKRALPAAETAERQATPAMLKASGMTLREAYDRYKANKGGFGRQDLFGYVVDALEELQRRIGAVDEAALVAISDRVSSLERVIGNALSPASASPRYPPLGQMNSGPSMTPPHRGPGRPPKVKTEADNA